MTSPRLVPRARCLARARALAPQEVAAVKKGPEKKAYLTLCQWQLAWNRRHLPVARPPRAPACYRAARGRYMVALVATGQLTWAEVQAHRDNCLKVAVQAARARFLVALCSPRVAAQAAASKRRVHLGIVYDEEARKARPCVRACAAPCVCAGAWQLWAEQLRSGGPDFKLGKTILRVDPRALQLARDACDKEDGATHATASVAPRGFASATFLRRFRARRHRRPALPRRRAGRAAPASRGAPRRAGAAAPGAAIGRRARSASARGAAIGRKRTRGRYGRRRARRSAERRPGRARASPRRGGAPSAVRTARAQKPASARAGSGP